MTILEPKYYMVIYRISYFSLLSALYAYYRSHYRLVVVPGSVFLTSINYWRKPEYSWRRDLDITVVKLALLYQCYMAQNSQYSKEYYTIVLVGCLCYPVGVYYYNKKDYWRSTFFHSLVHLLGNISNIVLYSGSIK
jgi:hypothetical protein